MHTNDVCAGHEQYRYQEEGKKKKSLNGKTPNVHPSNINSSPFRPSTARPEVPAFWDSLLFAKSGPCGQAANPRPHPRRQPGQSTPDLQGGGVGVAIRAPPSMTFFDPVPFPIAEALFFAASPQPSSFRRLFPPVATLASHARPTTYDLKLQTCSTPTPRLHEPPSHSNRGEKARQAEKEGT